MGGGRLTVWSRNGRELFFSSLDTRQMLAVQVQSGMMLVAGPPKVLFEIAMLVPPRWHPDVRCRAGRTVRDYPQ